MKKEPLRFDIQTTYDESQHCTAVKLSRDKAIGMDCPYTGKGEEH